MTSTYIDGDMFVTDGGVARSLRVGQGRGLERQGAQATGSLRPAPVYSIVTGGDERRVGNVYAFDLPNQRVVALGQDPTGGTSSSTGWPAEAPDWSDMRGDVRHRRRR